MVKTTKNSGSKAGSVNFGINNIKTKYTLIIDADTILAENAVEKMLPTMEDEPTAAASGFVIP